MSQKLIGHKQFRGKDHLIGWLESFAGGYQDTPMPTGRLQIKNGRHWSNVDMTNAAAMVSPIQPNTTTTAY